MNLNLNAQQSVIAENTLKGAIATGESAKILLNVLKGKASCAFVKHAGQDNSVMSKVVALFANPSHLAKAASKDSLSILAKGYHELATKGTMGKQTKAALLNAGKQAQIIRESCLFKYVQDGTELPEYFAALVKQAVANDAEKRANENKAKVDKALKAFSDLSLNDKQALLASLQMEVKTALADLPASGNKRDDKPAAEVAA